MWSLTGLIRMVQRGSMAYVEYCMCLTLAVVLLRIRHSVEALDSDLIGTVYKDHTKSLFQFGTELGMSAL